MFCTRITRNDWFFIVLAERHVVSHILNQSQPVFVLSPPYCIVINYAPLVKRRNFSHSWKKSQIFNRDSCKNLLLWTFKSTLYHFPHILAEYNTWIDNLHIFILRFVPKKMRSTGVSSTKMFFSGLADGLLFTRLSIGIVRKTKLFCSKEIKVITGYYILILFKQFYWLSCCHLTFLKICQYCLIKTRIDMVSLSFSFNVIKPLQSFVSVNTSFYGP